MLLSLSEIIDCANLSTKRTLVCLAFAFCSLFSLRPAFCLDGLQSFVYPLLATRLSSNFGDRKHPVQKVVRHHNGVDLAAPTGTPIRAVAGGRVVFADPYAGYGNLIVIDHGNTLTTHYGHCETISVKPGQTVLPGAILGTVGQTGLATGPHLHFEIRRNGEPYDPLKIVPLLASKGEG